MSTALQPSAIPAVPTAQEWDALRNAAAMMARSSMIPEHYRGKPENIMWAAQMARAYDVPLAYYMEMTYPLPGGKNGHYVKFKQAMATRACPDFEYVIIQNDDQACILEGWRGKRGDASRVRTSFTMEQARRIKQGNKSLAEKDTYRDYGPDMLFNRAMSRLVDRVCPDAGIRRVAPEIVTGFEDEDRELDRPQRSGAEVLEDGPGNAGAAPAALAPVPPTPLVVPVPIDWRGRLLEAFAACYGIKPPGESTKARNAFVKANEAKLVLVATEFYKGRGEPAPGAWMAVAPMDHEKIALWLEAKNEKRAGEGVPTASATGPKAGESQPATTNVFDDDLPAEGAPDATAPPEDDEAPAAPEPEPVVGGWMALAQRDHAGLTTLLLGMRHASKGERQYVQQSSRSGRYSLIDGDILKECGFVNAEGTPMGQFLDRLQDGVVWDGKSWSEPSPAVWPMLCRAVYDAAQVAGVSTQ